MNVFTFPKIKLLLLQYFEFYHYSPFQFWTSSHFYRLHYWTFLTCDSIYPTSVPSQFMQALAGGKGGCAGVYVDGQWLKELWGSLWTGLWSFTGQHGSLEKGKYLSPRFGFHKTLSLTTFVFAHQELQTITVIKVLFAESFHVLCREDWYFPSVKRTICDLNLTANHPAVVKTDQLSISLQANSRK